MGDQTTVRSLGRYQLDSDAGRLTTAERAARGKTARRAVPRESHAMFDPPSDRPDPIALLEEQAKSRVPELVPIRWGRMMVSPFTYYRGAALPMASDLTDTPVSGLAVQACGDAHLSNFGLPGPWEWDVKRLAASLEIAGRDNGFPVKQRRDIVTAAVARYRMAMREFASMTNLNVWYAHADITELRAAMDAQLRARQRKLLDQGLAKAHTRDSMQELAKLCQPVDGRPRIISDPPLLVPIDELIPAETDRATMEAYLESLIVKYRRTLETDRKYLLDQFRFCDAARKVVGVGSVGTRCWIVLMLGRDETDALFLQVKEAEASSDIFLGWQSTEAGLDGKPRDFYVRQLRDWKFSIEIATLRPEGLQMYGELCSWTLARAHARSGDRIAIASYLGGSDVFDRAIAKFAPAYADQNERDHQAVVDAVKSGRITAEQGL
jgi:hypothetical protein